MGWIKRLAHEPLVHFLLMGGGLFLAFGLTREGEADAPRRIVISASQVRQLSANFARTWVRQPTPKELQRQIGEYVRDEVFYREALALGLDRGDPLIRRRMRQKLEFILEDLSAEKPPGDRVLAAFLGKHPQKFRQQPRVSFEQVYLNPHRRRELQADAKELLGRLRAGAAPAELGDPTQLEPRFTLVRQSEIARSFGEPFARQLVALEPGAWQGPLTSGLGAHLVRVSQRQQGRLPGLAEIRPLVQREWLAQRRVQLRDRNYRKLLEGYEVVVQQPPAAEAPP